MRNDDDDVGVNVEFSWTLVGPVQLDPETDSLSFASIEAPGLYRLRSGRSNHPGDFDCWYVGRSLVSVNKRIACHVSTEYDAERRSLKRFKANLAEADGWVELDRAVNLRINGSPHLRTTPPSDRTDDPDEWEVVELVWNVLEAAGLVADLDLKGRSSKR